VSTLSPLPRAGLPRGYKQQILAQLKDTLAPLRQYFDDETVNEIMVNAPNEVFLAAGGRKHRIDVQLSGAAITAAITLLATLVAAEVGEKSNRRILSARLPGFRVEAIMAPVAVNGPSMCIRRHASRVFSIQEYVERGTMSEHYAEVLTKAVLDRENFLIVGGTASGKTTLMNAVLATIPREDRLFVIESVHELQVQSPNHVLLECDEDGGVTARKAVRTAMRYAPDRIIVGELRGPEAYDWLDAANTGHPGSGATIHANSAPRALPRLENLLLMANMGVPHEAIRTSVAETVNLMVYIHQRDGQRSVSQVSRLVSYDRVRGESEIEKL
jgi:pilus assembly protein CpaF